MKIYTAHFQNGYNRHEVKATTEDFETVNEFKAWIQAAGYEKTHGKLIHIETEEAR